MKLTCNRSELLDAFSNAAAMIPSRSPKPILQNVKLDANAGKITLMATDLENGLRVDIPCDQVERPGKVLLPAARFRSILDELNDDTVNLGLSGDTVHVRASNSQFQLSSAKAEEFPDVASARESSSRYAIKGSILSGMIRRTAFVSNDKEARFALAGVLFEFEPQRITAVGVSGPQLSAVHGASREAGTPHHRAPAFQVIVPTKAVRLIERLFAEDESEVMFSVDGSRIFVESEGTMLAATMLQGRFPKWQSVLEYYKPAGTARVSVRALHAGIRQASVVAGGDVRWVDIAFSASHAAISCETAEVGKSSIRVPIECTGPKTTVRLKASYITDYLRLLPNDAFVGVEYSEASSVTVWRSGEDMIYAAMPLSRD